MTHNQMNTTGYQPSSRPRWEAFRQSFKQSNYITDFWNWLMTLLSKAAEMVLFGSVLYSGYELLPGVLHAPAEVDAIVFVIQQAALDIGGMGLLKLAKRAGLAKDSFPMRVGITLVALMIVNVVLASLKQSIPGIPVAVFTGIETLLLIARAIMAVLFGHAIHALREEYDESTITVKEAKGLQQDIEMLATELAHIQQDIQRQMVSGQAVTDRRFTDLSEQVRVTDRRLSDLSDRLTDNFQSLQAISQEHTSAFDRLAALPASLSGLEQSLLSITTAPSQKPHLSVVASDRSRQSEPASQPTGTHRPTDSEPTDKATFVRRCLTDNPMMRVSDIQRRATAQGLTIAHSYISDLRKAFLAEQEKRTQQEPA